MKIFLTGATGYIGSVVAEALIDGGHAVSGLVRSEEAERKLEASGVSPVAGNLRDTEILASAARDADGVIHAGAEWSAEMGAVDLAATEAMTNALAGSGKPFVYTSGVWLLGDTGPTVASDDAPVNPPGVVAWRPAVEELVRQAAQDNVRGVVIRPAMVYGREGGAIGDFVKAARGEGVVKYVGHGENHWSFVHVEPLAELYRLAVEKAAAGSVYVVAAGPAYRVREVAETVAAANGAVAESWPIENARQVLGPLADGLTLDQRIAGSRAQSELGWTPAAVDVMDEIRV